MLTTEQKENIEILREKGHSYNSIAGALGLSFKQVRGYFDRKAKTHLCLQCQKPVKQTAHRKEKKFCSDKCRSAWWNKENKNKTIVPRHTQECIYCHQTFRCYKSKSQQYCSRECYANARRKEENNG